MGWGSNIFPLLIVTSSGGFTGLFVYSPSPGHGNLIYSVTGASGTDPYGNPFTATATMYGPTPAGGTGPSKVNTSTSPKLGINFASGSATEAQAGDVNASVLAAGGAAEQQLMFMGGPVNTVSADAVFIELQSSPHNAAGHAKGLAGYQDPSGGTVQNLMSWSVFDGVRRASSNPGGGGVGGISGGIPIYLSDTFSRTATTVAATDLTVSYNIPANDPLLYSQQNTSYRLHCWGNGSQGGAVHTGNFQVFLYGVLIYQSSALNFCGVGGTFTWDFDIVAQVTSTGVAGNVNTGGQFASIDAALTTPGTLPLVDIGNAVNTTVASVMKVSFIWSALGPSITCANSEFIRGGA